MSCSSVKYVTSDLIFSPLKESDETSRYARLTVKEDLSIDIRIIQRYLLHRDPIVEQFDYRRNVLPVQ